MQTFFNSVLAEQEFLTQSELCHLLHISRWTVTNWIRLGKLTPYRITNRNLYKTSDVENLLASSKKV